MITAITPQKLILLLPLLIIGFTIIGVMFSIAWRRNHFFNAIFSMVGLNFALVSLWYPDYSKITEITPLICINNHTVLYTAMLLVSSFIVCIFAYPWLENFNGNKEEFYLLILIATFGGILLVNANHLVSLFLGIELISLPLFGMISYVDRHCQYSIEVSIKYMILSAVASSFLLFGIALLYAQSGNLSFISFANSFSEKILQKPLLFIGLGLIIISFSFKLSVVPCHLWMPDVYHVSSASVSAFLATISKIATCGAIVRLFSYIINGANESLSIVLGIISFMSIIFGNIMALNQINIKRLLGYSSIAHSGYLLVTIIGLNNKQMSIESISIYLISYMFSNLSIFGIINLMPTNLFDPDNNLISYYRGLFWYHPVLSVIMTISIFSLAGVPMTLGFFAKVYLVLISLQTQLWWLITAVLFGSLIGFYYYLRIVVNLYLRAPKELNYDYNVMHNWQYSANGVVILITSIFMLIFGIYPQPLIDMVISALHY